MVQVGAHVEALASFLSFCAPLRAVLIDDWYLMVDSCYSLAQPLRGYAGFRGSFLVFADFF